jgi:hypothetical protein
LFESKRDVLVFYEFFSKHASKESSNLHSRMKS